LENFRIAFKILLENLLPLQELRHQCDYDPLSETPKTTVEAEIGSLRQVIQDFSNTSVLDLRAFCAFVLFPAREDPLRQKIEEQRKRDKAEFLRAEQEARGHAVRAERAAKRFAREAEAKA